MHSGAPLNPPSQVLTLASLLMIVRIVMTWYPEIDGKQMPWAIAYTPTGAGGAMELRGPVRAPAGTRAPAAGGAASDTVNVVNPSHVSVPLWHAPHPPYPPRLLLQTSCWQPRVEWPGPSYLCPVACHNHHNPIQSHRHTPPTLQSPFWQAYASGLMGSSPLVMGSSPSRLSLIAHHHLTPPNTTHAPRPPPPSSLAEPLLAATRKVVKPFNGLDVSPIVWVALLSFISEVLTGPQGILSLIERKGI